jgi:hypothetical protein
MCQVRLSDSKHAVKPFIKIKKDKKNNEWKFGNCLWYKSNVYWCL